VTDELFAVRGKVALVTGGTSGIGRMIARGLVRRGVKTYIVGRDLAQGEAVAAELSAENPVNVAANDSAEARVKSLPDDQCIGLAADLSDAHGPERLAAELARLEPRLNILINNAGASESGNLETVSIEDWDKVLNVNLRAGFFLIQHLLPQLRAAATARDPARIINIGSIGGLHIPNWDAFPYGASKAALHHMTRALTKRLGKDNIVANAIAPGPFPSRLTNTDSDAVKKSVQTYIPLRRAGEPEDIEGLVVFLASRAGAYVNGTTIALDGGYLAAL
jgi:NAD(P)-dependent dehydrogenase (short-subunit alcohol dehydrogenase family)